MASLTRIRLGRRFARASLAIALLAAASAVFAEDAPIRLRLVETKPKAKAEAKADANRKPGGKRFYEPGEVITLEMRCAAGITDVEIQYNPTLQDGDAGFVFQEEPKCPLARFAVPIPPDFLGKNRVTATTRNRVPPATAVFRFEVRSDVQPSDLWFSTDTQSEGCNLRFLRDDSEPPTVEVASVLPNGTRLDLCREGKVSVGVVPPDGAVFAMKDGACTLTLRKPGALKVVASYRGLRKEWPCSDYEAPDPARRFR